MDTLVLHDTIISGENYYENGFFLQGVYGDGEYLYQRRVRFVDRCDSLYQLLLYVDDTTTVIPDDPDDPEDPPIDTTGIHGLTLSTPTIFPNPFNDQLTIRSEGNVPYHSIKIFNSIGELVYCDIPRPHGGIPTLYGRKIRF